MSSQTHRPVSESRASERHCHTGGSLPPPEHPGYLARQEAFRNRLRRIEGQVKGISRMIDDEVYCIDVLTQISAATRALQAVALGLLDEHLAHCVLDAAKVGGPEADERLREASEAIARLVKS